MSLFNVPFEHVVEDLNRTTLTPLTASSLYFSPVLPGDETDVVRVRLTTLDSYQYRGTQVITYERLDLGVLAHRLTAGTVSLVLTGPLYDNLALIRQHLGIYFDETDVENSSPVVDGEGRATLTLVAKPASYRWVGSFTLTLTPYPPLSTLLPLTNLLW